MTKEINIVLDEMEVVRKSGGAMFPNLKINTMNVAHIDELAGMLLVAYADTADEFLRQHPKHCTYCPAYIQHKTIIATIRMIQNKLRGKNYEDTNIHQGS